MNQSDKDRQMLPGDADQLEADTAALRRVLAEEARRIKPAACPVLVALCGLPGTGKTHLARQLARRLPFLIMESDRLRKALVGEPRYTSGESARLFAACHRLIAEYLTQNLRVIFDATNLAEAHREPLYRLAESCHAPLLLVHCRAPRHLVRHRLLHRQQAPPPGNHSDADWLVYCRMAPNEEPIARPHLAVDSSQDIRPVINHIIHLINYYERERARGRPVASRL